MVESAIACMGETLGQSGKHTRDVRLGNFDLLIGDEAL
jgi:hypothetical protein